MELHLLGPIEVRLGDRTLPLGARKQRAVLAMLGLQANRTVSSGHLAEGLWGEDTPPSAPKMVQLYVSQLRRILDGDGAEIVTHGRGYELRLPADDVDTARFERLVQENHPRDALELWRGDALSDVADEPFAAAEVRRLDEQRLHAHELAVAADLGAGRHAEVVAELERLVAEHPLREGLHAQRMLALYRSERQAEALDAYREARSAVVEQIGVEPGPELQRLQRAILAQDPALDLPAAAPVSPAPPRPSARFSIDRRLARTFAAAAVLAAAAGLIVFGVSRVTAPDRIARIDENAVGLIDPDNGRITAQYAVGRSPGAVVTGGGSVWVANTLDHTISRIDHGRRQVASIDVRGEPTALAFGAGSLWVANGETRRVAQVDPGSNRVVQTLAVGNASRAVAVGFGALWVASSVDGALRRIDLAHPDEGRSIPLAGRPTALAAGAGAIWVVSEEAGTVTRIEPRSGAVLRAISVGNGPSAIAVGEGAVWVVNRPDGTVSRIDPRTNAVSGLVRVGGDPAAVAAGDGAVWVAGRDGKIARLDPYAPKVRQRIEVGSSGAGIAVADGSVWAAAVAPPGRHRGGTLRVLSDVAAIDPIIPDGYDWRTFQLVSLAYDGLVGYRRVGGVAGATLVGALATDVPRPGAGGRTYVFTLRPGTRYSDGRPVRPEDFRASMERFLRVADPDRFSPFYASIVGAERCVRRPARCDLTAGIETDPEARTITVHLTQPDGEFLHKLTLPFAYLLPADTPVRPTLDEPPPGTGPYRFASWRSGRGGSLVRNRHFRSWSPRDRPAGFPDRIEVVIRKKPRIRRQVADVERGSADLAVLANPFRAVFPSSELDALAVRFPSQLHSHAEAVLNFMFLNVRRAPFDDIRVRRALNYATDRARLVELEDGPAFATPSCQFQPSGFPGHRPYCPYSAHAAPGRAWTAPDMERARELIAATGTAGRRVVVSVPDFQRDAGRYFVGLLGKLGYRASLRVIAAERYFGFIADPSTQPQIGFVGWQADYASPSAFISPNFSCSQPNPSHFCLPALDRQAERALATEGAAAGRRWAAIDRRLADLAPAVPLTNRRSIDLVSERVGNVQHAQQVNTLLEQLWVR